MTARRSPIVDLSFPHRWQAEMLAARPLILPPRHFVYPQEAEEVERGALEVLIRPDAPGAQPVDSAAEGRSLSGHLCARVFAIRQRQLASGLLQNQKKSAPSQEAMRT